MSADAAVVAFCALCAAFLGGVETSDALKPRRVEYLYVKEAPRIVYRTAPYAQDCAEVGRTCRAQKRTEGVKR